MKTGNWVAGETDRFSGEVVLSVGWFLEAAANWAHLWPQQLTLREERRLMVFENRVLRRILGSKRDEVTGEWRKLHNEELNDLYWSQCCSGNEIFGSKRDEVTGEWRKLHNEELYDIYCSHSVVRV